ncbi:DUF3011 domain-containing protein [Dyella japonica]|uniref:DUF3011 domain-containing protein n=1 Tax=Dyella japonica TaxID=231455 RepID=UPI003CCD1045
MRGIRLCVLALSMLSASAAFAQEVTCESQGSKRTECPMDTEGAVRLVKQLSNSPCTEGVSWGLSKHAVWVERGCRGVFAKDTGASTSAAPSGGLQLVNATCPGHIAVHADRGGPVYINGKEAKLKKFNENYFEARDEATGTVVSINNNPDGSVGVSYTGKNRANGICQVTAQ